MLSLDENERQIVDAAGTFLDGVGGLIRTRRVQAREVGLDRSVWSQMAELGWFGAGVPEAKGGLGLSVRELILLFEQCGTKLMPEPLVPVVAAAQLIATGASKEAVALLDQVIKGTAVCVPVLPQPAEEDAESRGPATSGFAHEAAAADWFVLGIGAGKDFRLVAAQRGTPGLILDTTDTVDGGSMAAVGFAKLDASRTLPLASGPVGEAAYGFARDFVRLGYAALLAGLSKEALRITLIHLKDRKQFGVPVGSFQALQHRCATMHVDIISSRAFLYEACQAFGTERQSLAATAIKARTSEMAMKVVRECVQFHGAMGYTDEHNISLFFKRAMGLSAAAGDAISCLKFISSEAGRLRMLEQA